jgi:hypothetical protein
MSNKGFVIFAEGPDYVEQAYLCAMSIIASNNSFPVSLITSGNIKDKYKWVFHKIIEIPWYKPAVTQLKTENRWKIYHASPYEQTIVLDSDTLVLQNLDYFWDFLKNYNLYFPAKVFTYRKEVIEDDYYRKAFTNNNLPSLYNAIHYFKKGSFAHNFYKWVEIVTNNWELFYGRFCSENYPKEPSMDITVSIVSKVLDCDTEISNQKFDLPQLVHMKPLVQKWKNPTSKWQDRVGTYLTPDLKLKIGNHLQNTVFHYTENDFVTKNIIGKFEKCLKK